MGRPVKPQAGRDTWKKDPEAVKSNILSVAVCEFGEHGLSGARIDEIAKKTTTSKRMIYYYFGDKEKLYQAVLEAEYSRFREAETALALQHLEPVLALRTLTEFTFDWHSTHPEFIRLLATENAAYARHLEHSDITQKVNSTIIKKVEKLLKRGEQSSDFNAGLDPILVHMMMCATSFYNMSNRYTFSLNFDLSIRDSPDRQKQIREYLVQMIFGLVLKTDVLQQQRSTVS